jgi:hypothetical protein
MVRVRSSVAAIALVLLVGGCGKAAPTQRSQVVAYLKQVNAVERQLGQPLLDVTHVAAGFSRRGGGGGIAPPVSATVADVAKLGADLRQIRSLRHRLATIPHPPTATHLRALLLALVDRQAGLTRQTAQLEEFLPRFNVALGPIVPASRQLEQALSVNTGYGAAAVQAVYARKAAALRAFKATLDNVLAALAGLHPPPVSRPNYRAQVEALQGMSTSAGKLSVALQSSDRSSIPALLAAFDRAAVAPRTSGALRAQIAAARAYDRQTTQVKNLAVQADRERQRLATSLR